jgi:hypothetical protein
MLSTMLEKNWPTVCASEVRQGFQDRSRGMKGSQESLTTAVVKDAANWPTATATNRVRNEETMAKCAAFRKRNANQNTVPLYLEEVVLRQEQHGQAAPASSSSLGSRQGLSWATPRANERDGTRTPNGNPKKDGIPLGMQAQQWATPAAFDWNTAENKAAWEKRAAEQKSKGVNLHLPLKSQAIHEAEKQWATPRNCGGPDYAKTTRPSSQSNSLSLPTQVAGKLNPRWVETLMGLPIGWVMPSCTSPQTIAPMSCDSSAMELSLPPQSELSEFSLAS